MITERDCLKAIDTIEKFLTCNGKSDCCGWSDKNGDGFLTDMGYFEHGLCGLKAYCLLKCEEV